MRAKAGAWYNSCQIYSDNPSVATIAHEVGNAGYVGHYSFLKPPIMGTRRKPEPITSIEQLKKLASHSDGIECFIHLGHNLRSSKQIFYDDEEKKFQVNNFIDDSSEHLTEKELFTDSNIGEAINRGNFYKT